MTPLSPKERLRRAARGLEVDRIPSIGGWMLGVHNLAAIANLSVADYLRDPLAGTVRANLNLGVDGMVQPVVPARLDEIRTGLVQEEKFAGVEPEAIRDYADTLPDSDREVLSAFDPAREEARYRDYFTQAFARWGGIEPIPNFWEIGGHFPLYTEFGYTAFFMATVLYPEAVGKIYHQRSLHSRERAKILLRLYREFDLVPLMFCGEDVCNNQGPMVSPAFLRRHYFPGVRMIIEPLVDAGIRLVHHCDGDVRPVLDDFTGLGFSGFQGFQYELGIDLSALHARRSALGEAVLLFTGLSVSRTLPFGTEEEVRAEVDFFFDCTDGGRGMFLFTSNVSGVEVPPGNLIAAYQRVKELTPGAALGPHRPWRDVTG